MIAPTGLSGVGVALPRTRLAAREVHRVWENVPWGLVERAGIVERTVCEPDMDALTLAADSARRALRSAEVETVDAIFLGTQTSPYLSRASAGVLVDVLGVGPDVFAVDLQFAGKSGTAALLMAAAWVASGFGARALAVGSDTLGVHAAPGDPFEYGAGSGAAAFVVDRDARLATLERVASFTSDTPDGYRMDGERYFHRGGTTMTVTDVGYPAHARGAWAGLMGNIEAAASTRVDRLVLQQPDAAQPRRIAAVLGMASSSLEGCVLADRIGDTGAASPLLALARTLTFASAGDVVGVVSYGVGAGSDALLLHAVSQPPPIGLDELIAGGVAVDYATAARFERRYQSHPRLVSTFE
jgi:hydroxymethylglutaryl-CoA synthase